MSDPKAPLPAPSHGGPAYDIDNIFTYHPPFGTQQDRYLRLRGYGKTLAQEVLDSCPPSAERTLALRKIEEAVMWANASIARNEKGPRESDPPDTGEPAKKA